MQLFEASRKQPRYCADDVGSQGLENPCSAREAMLQVHIGGPSLSAMCRSIPRAVALQQRIKRKYRMIRPARIID